MFISRNQFANLSKKGVFVSMHLEKDYGKGYLHSHLVADRWVCYKHEGKGNFLFHCDINFQDAYSYASKLGHYIVVTK